MKGESERTVCLLNDKKIDGHSTEIGHNHFFSPDEIAILP